MDVDALLDRIPTDTLFQLLSSAGQKSGAEQAAVLVLDAIEADGRQPDRWESGWLHFALTTMATGHYDTAIRFVRMALMTVDERAPTLAPGRDDINWQTLAELRDELAKTQVAPVKAGLSSAP